MLPPFVIFSLPRSRSAWLASWLSAAAQAPVGHDVAIECDTIDDWLETIYRRVRGTCETGAVEAWPVLRQAMPDCRIAVIWRDPAEVAQSLASLGIDVPESALAPRRAALLELGGQPGVLAVEYETLTDPRVCAQLQEHCLCGPFNWQLWQEWDQRNVQVDIPARMARLAERASEIAALKSELTERLAQPRPWITVGEEPWSVVADDCEALGSDHHDEAKAGTEGAFRLNRAALAEMERLGLWRVFVARVDSRLVGYCCWSRETNVEADAPPTAIHGPFYVVPEFRAHALGRRLLDVSRRDLAAAGYKLLRLHHTMHGRGARAGALYQRMGAVEYQREYILRI